MYQMSSISNNSFMDPEKIAEDERLCEKDMSYLRSCYPARAKKMLNVLYDACDKMEYEGSSMLAEYPDKEMMHYLADQIYENCQKIDALEINLNEPVITGQREVVGAEAVEAVEKDLLFIMLCDEIHRRRMRYRRRSQLFSEL